MNIQALLISTALVFLAGLGAGWKYEHGRFMDFKQEVAVEAAKQEAKVESIQKQQTLVTKGIENEYNAKLAAIKSYYTGGLRQPGSSSMSGIPQSTTSIDGKATNLELACAYTTQQLVSLQDWINGQVGIK